MALTPLEIAPETNAMPDVTAENEIAGRTPFQIAFSRLRADKLAVACFSVVLLFFLIAIFAPVLTRLFGVELRAGRPVPGHRHLQLPRHRPARPPLHVGGSPGPGAGHGQRQPRRVALRRPHLAQHRCVVTVVSTLIGISVGLIAGFSRGWLDRVIAFVIDVFLSLPFLLLALAVAPIIVLRFDDQPNLLKFCHGHLPAHHL